MKKKKLQIILLSLVTIGFGSLPNRGLGKQSQKPNTILSLFYDMGWIPFWKEKTVFNKNNLTPSEECLSQRGAMLAQDCSGLILNPLYLLVNKLSIEYLFKTFKNKF